MNTVILEICALSLIRSRFVFLLFNELYTFDIAFIKKLAVTMSLITENTNLEDDRINVCNRKERTRSYDK